VEPIPYGTWEVLREGRGLAILAIGTMVLPALEAAERLAEEGVQATVVNCRFAKPYDREVFEEVVGSHSVVLTVEEGAVTNGFGAFMAREIDGFAGTRNVRVQCLGLPDHFIEHGARSALLADLGLDVDGIHAVALGLAKQVGLVGAARESA
jgi:1-deoxy-D-xylulose-5-phosphate synthase